jgi:aryl-alcohol dehydrogenase-like predicted oxidoreductase
MSQTTNRTSAVEAGIARIGGYTINRLGFGAMRITGEGIWGQPADPKECERVLRRALELDVNFIDTADAYGPEVSEELIARALHPYPEGLLIGTKAGLVRPGPGRWTPDGRPKHLRQAVEGSLRRLRLERLPLLQLHRPDPKVPLADSIGTLADLQREGKIEHIGLCNVGRLQLEEAAAMVQVVSVQNRYNLLDRDSDGVLDACQAGGIAFIPWRPIDGGEITGDGGGLEQVARRHGVGVAQIAIAWLLHRSQVMVPIPGTSRVAHLEENVAAAAIRLDESEYEALSAIAA